MHSNDGGRRSALRALVGWLEATPSELAGLLVLVVSAAAATAVLWWQARPVPVPTPEVAPTTVRTATPGRLAVHVAGAVAAPGVVAVARGARVIDAVEAAGGPLVDADLSRLNLARAVDDGERLVVPRAGEPTAGPSVADGRTSPTGPGRVDLNRATAAELEALPGIGPVLAERIVEHREAKGPFEEPGDLRGVSGIGEHTFQAVAERVTAR